ncbi:Serum response factor [Thelohanellus kitauei]|uniref:Serum response factor n=1 Tax=Thelohanellus kitauei TaxID=669202 RepID=A0A0C2NGX0_THEKT|nr:Serum response factor [Thelohanellus kitauei]
MRNIFTTPQAQFSSQNDIYDIRQGKLSSDDNIGIPPLISSKSADAVSDTARLGRGRGRVKLDLGFIDDKTKRASCFCKRKNGLMKKAHELSVLTGTEVMLLIASETGRVYTFATDKLKPILTSDSGKALIETCLASPDQTIFAEDFTEFDMLPKTPRGCPEFSSNPYKRPKSASDYITASSPTPLGPLFDTSIFRKQY